jgi:hypothetical protein
MQFSQTTDPTACPPAVLAWRGLVRYFVIVAALSPPIQAVIMAADLDGNTNGPTLWLALIALLMVVPTVAALAARCTLGEPLADRGWRLGGRWGCPDGTDT